MEIPRGPSQLGEIDEKVLTEKSRQIWQALPTSQRWSIVVRQWCESTLQFAVLLGIPLFLFGVSIKTTIGVVWLIASSLTGSAFWKIGTPRAP